MKIKIIYLTFLAIFFLASNISAQDGPAENWFNQDAQDDKANGVSTEKAYEYLKGRESKTDQRIAEMEF